MIHPTPAGVPASAAEAFMIRVFRALAAGSFLAGLLAVIPLFAQAPAGRGAGQGGPPPVVSVEVSADKRITFRIAAPQAQAVRVVASDIPNIGQGAMTKDTSGVWEVTVGPVPAGAYRYNFNVDGVATLDPRNLMNPGKVV